MTDPDERTRLLAPPLRSRRLVSGMVGISNLWRAAPEEIARKCEGMPLFRIQATGPAAGPEGLRGWFWVVPIAGSALS